jgi:hypothetical protein
MINTVSISRMRNTTREDFFWIIISRLTHKETGFEEATLPRLPDHSRPPIYRSALLSR